MLLGGLELGGDTAATRAMRQRARDRMGLRHARVKKPLAAGSNDNDIDHEDGFWDCGDEVPLADRDLS